jgi:hypothetical protein
MGKVLVCWCAPLTCHAEELSLTDFLDCCRISNIAGVSKVMTPCAQTRTGHAGWWWMNPGFESLPHRYFGKSLIPNLSAVGDETWLNRLNGKTVRIHGRINIYHAIPEIRIISKNQVDSE